MDKNTVDQFWRKRSMQGCGRWTQPCMLEYELTILMPHVTPNCRILDLGSGPASLSRRLLAPSASLTAVDKYGGFLDSIPPDRRTRVVCRDVIDFDYPHPYDLILLFGVVTHLDPDEELKVYEGAARGLARSGIFAVKNQVSRTVEKVVDGYSADLDCDYVARYPDIPGQRERLGRFFSTVTVLPYPPEFNQWPDTEHVCFLCSET
ncbi:MAG TPA: class I SAM-dependent methyltransferase [Candidatus Accumulibacter phosphatis]|nr:class I SAM-dependent methyltransferase [Candidatus Accumulibacter phosphatis]